DESSDVITDAEEETGFSKIIPLLAKNTTNGGLKKEIYRSTIPSIEDDDAILPEYSSEQKSLLTMIKDTTSNNFSMSFVEHERSNKVTLNILNTSFHLSTHYSQKISLSKKQLTLVSRTPIQLVSLYQMILNQKSLPLL
ncbi:hypothetical protein MXB_5433, partial [Myxobolus squamalis]